MREEGLANSNEIVKELEEVNEKLAPILTEALEKIDIKTAIIYFAGLTKNFLDILDDENFNQIIVQYLTDGD